jgi:ankyrin repeat protein
MKSQLHSILSKYPFVHIDKVGELTMLVPLTGARTVSADFVAGAEKATSLYLFGDNTCQSDLERKAFFNPPYRAGNQRRGFDTLFSELISELKGLKRLQRVTKDQDVIQSIIDSLNEQKKEVDKLKEQNPDTNKMRTDLCVSMQGFVTKGEFVVKSADSVRHLNLPNLLNLIITSANKEKMLPDGFAQDRDIFNYLDAIPNAKDKKTLEKNLIKVIKDYGLKTCQQELTSRPTQLFKALYVKLKNTSYPGLITQPDNFYDVLTDNLRLLSGWHEDYRTYTLDELVDTIQSIFKQSLAFEQVEEIQEKSFSAIYQQTLSSFATINRGNAEKTNSFKLFSLQTFLFLCSLQLRLKNLEKAKEFLTALQDPKKAKELIRQLCTKEAEFKQMLQTQYGVSTEEYDALIDSAYEIISDHVEAPHFDELRVSCLSEELENTHYLVLGGRLCWSTAEITEDGTINSAEQKKRKFSANFEQFYKHKEAYLERREHIKLLEEMLNGEDGYDEVALQSLEFNAQHFSYSQKISLLEMAINKKKYKCAEFLVDNGAHNEKLFKLAFDQNPPNMPLISSFARANHNYMGHFATAGQLAKAIREDRLEFVKIIFMLAPNLLETRIANGCTPLLYACQEGKTNLVDYFMSIGANVLATSSGGQTTARDYAAKRSHDKRLTRLFSDYHSRVREQLSTGDSFPLLSTSEYFLTALKRQETQLVNVLLEFFPNLKNEITIGTLIKAVKDKSLPRVRAILELKPELLNEGDRHGKTALFHACKLNNVSIAQYLMNNRANIFKPNNRGKLPRDAASEIGTRNLFIPYYRELARDSEQHRAIFTSDNYQLAIMANDFSLADCILQKYPEFANDITHEHLFNAIRVNSLEAVKYILNHKADLLEYKDPRNKTPFFYACETNSLAIADYLMMIGANVHAGEITAFQPSATSYSGYTVRRAKDLSSNSALQKILDTYIGRLPSVPAKNISAGHIIDAIDARDLSFVTYYLNRSPKLKQGLSESDLQHIEQQRMQEKLYGRYEQLIQTLNRKRDQFSYSNRSDSPYRTLNNLSEKLNSAGTQFFKTHVSPETLKQFESACTEALEDANQVLSIHRGWHGFPLWMRAIIGIIATATFIPAITVYATTTKGYVGTFFKSYETDSVMHTKQFSSEFDSIKTELLSVI